MRKQGAQDAQGTQDAQGAQHTEKPLKPSRIITRVKNGDDPSDASFLDHESVRLIEEGEPIPEPSEDLYVLKIYDIEDIVNMNPKLKDMLQKSADSAREKDAGMESSKSGVSHSGKAKGGDRHKRGLEDEQEIERTTAEVIELLLQQKNTQALAIIKQNPKMLSKSFTHKGHNMSSAIAISGYTHKQLVTTMVEHNLFTLNAGIVWVEAGGGGVHISYPAIAIAASNNVKLIEFLEADNGKMATRVAEADGIDMLNLIMKPSYGYNNLIEFAISRGSYDVAGSWIKSQFDSFKVPFNDVEGGANTFMRLMIDAVKSGDQKLIDTMLHSLKNTNLDTRSFRSLGLKVDAPSFLRLKAGILTVLPSSNAISQETFVNMLDRLLPQELDMTVHPLVDDVVKASVVNGNENLFNAIGTYVSSRGGNFGEMLKQYSMDYEGALYNIVADAAMSKNNAIFNTLIDSGCRVRAESPRLIDPLFATIVYGTPEMMQRLIDSGVVFSLTEKTYIPRVVSFGNPLVHDGDKSNLKHVNLLHLAAVYNPAILEILFFNREDSFIKAFPDIYGEYSNQNLNNNIDWIFKNFLTRIYSANPETRAKLMKTNFWHSIPIISLAVADAQNVEDPVKRLEDIEKKYLTPSGDQPSYIRSHALSNSVDSFGVSTTSLAISYQNWDIVDKILDYKGDPQ